MMILAVGSSQGLRTVGNGSRRGCCAVVESMALPGTLLYFRGPDAAAGGDVGNSFSIFFYLEYV